MARKYFLAGSGHHYSKPVTKKRPSLPKRMKTAIQKTEKKVSAPIAAIVRAPPKPRHKPRPKPAPKKEEEKQPEPVMPALVATGAEAAGTQSVIIEPPVIETPVVEAIAETPAIEEEVEVEKSIEEMTEKEIEKKFKPKKDKRPSAEQRRELLAEVPMTPPGEPVVSFIDRDIIPPQAQPPKGLVYRDVKYESAPDGIQVLYRQWLEEFRKGMGAKSPSTLNFLVHGPPGTGKTESWRYFAQDANLPFWNIQGESLDPMALFGAWTKDEETGKITFQEGNLVKAVRSGGVLLLDELNAFPQDVQIRLNELLDDRRSLNLRETGEYIKADPELIIVGTMNPPGEGTHDLIPQLKSRFQKRLWMPLPSEEQQLEIVKARLRLPKSKFEKIEPDLDRTLRLIKNLGEMELSYKPTLREAVTMGRDLSGGHELKSSLVSDFLDIYSDPDERKAVAETINSTFSSVEVNA